MGILSELFFCASVSLDGFTIGCSYGVRKLQSTIITNIISALVCGFASAMAIFFGKIFLMFFSQDFAFYLGIILLLTLGSYTIIKELFSKKESSPPNINRKITIKESLALSFVVSIDAFSAGLGYAMMGHTSWLIPLGVAIFHPIFISLGMKFSNKIIKIFPLSKKVLSLISGGIIIALAVTRLIF